MSVPANTTSVSNREISDSFKCCYQAQNETCVSPAKGLFRNPKDCHSYIECVIEPNADSHQKEGLPRQTLRSGKKEKTSPWSGTVENLNVTGLVRLVLALERSILLTTDLNAPNRQ
jgi:hypothetical protein